MIAIKLQGGLGNVMFQIATIEYLGKTFNQEVCYTNVDAWLDDAMANYAWEKHAENYLTLFPVIDFYKNHTSRFPMTKTINVPFRYERIEADHGYLFNGYFQSEQYFPDSNFIRELFTPNDTVKEELVKYDSLLQTTTCSVSVRRGNYINLQSHHCLLSMDYYNKAIVLMREAGVQRFLIFSNDIGWCKNNFIGEEFVFIEDIDYIELFLMNKCNHHIISNSSFGWWGAWLGETSSTKTLAPELWFGNGLPTDFALDIAPNRWLKL